MVSLPHEDSDPIGTGRREKKGVDQIIQNAGDTLVDFS
jgi:hypothetical protein